jgi:pyruvate dehydrogenase E2 component (dihydrolipoamide acetyltransferase)
MPALEMAQETGKLISWLKKEGQQVAKGEPLLEVETDKAVMEVEAPGDGILAGIKVREGDVVPVGQTIAWLVAPAGGGCAGSFCHACSQAGAARRCRSRGGGGAIHRRRRQNLAQSSPAGARIQGGPEPGEGHRSGRRHHY